MNRQPHAFTKLSELKHRIRQGITTESDAYLLDDIVQSLLAQQAIIAKQPVTHRHQKAGKPRGYWAPV